jgi:membrane-associated phospholipid phosphatase
LPGYGWGFTNKPMEYLAGYAVFQWIATWANPYCDVLFRAITDLGYHTFYYLVIAPLFWMVDRRRASVLFLLILASGLLNTGAKLLVHTPRPDPHLARVLDFRPYDSGSNAFPSGHAQNAVVFWIYVAWWVGRRWFYGLALALIALISFSRLYLAVHFPIDIVGGLVIGTAIMVLLPSIFERWSRSEFRLSLAGSLGLTGASVVLALAAGDRTLAVIGGSLLGFMAGAVWLPQRPLLFRGAGQPWFCLAGGLVLLVGLSVAFDAFPTSVPLLLYARVAVLWIVALWFYPQLMRRFLVSEPVPATTDDPR